MLYFILLGCLKAYLGHSENRVESFTLNFEDGADAYSCSVILDSGVDTNWGIFERRDIWVLLLRISERKGRGMLRHVTQGTEACTVCPRFQLFLKS